MKLNTDNILLVVEKYFFELNSPINRKYIIDDLNESFFPENIAKFVDETHYDDKFIYANDLTVSIEYKNTKYGVIDFIDKVLPQVERQLKLRRIQNG